MAVRYQVSVRTIDYWRSDRILPYFKKGAIVRCDPIECDIAMRAFRSKSRYENKGSHETNASN
jgi:hypothetical protein